MSVARGRFFPPELAVNRRAPTAFVARMKSHPYNKRGSGKGGNGSRFFRDRRLHADGFIIRVQAAIRADGCRPRKI
jgi:hypothetical protein